MKADLIALLSEQSTQEIPALPLRTKQYKKKLVDSVKIILHPQQMNKLEEQDIAKTIPVAKSKQNNWYGWLVGYVPKPVKSAVSNTFSNVKSSTLSLFDNAKEILKYVGEKEENQEQIDDDANLTLQKHKSTLKGAYRSFVVPGLSKADIDDCID